MALCVGVVGGIYGIGGGSLLAPILATRGLALALALTAPATSAATFTSPQPCTPHSRW
ncbi:hypothetical protein AB0D34_39315 [Streptomyces sp. NPDC048420]|uniref:hypothetical protein n=1 Tax=Streptomyces sp. NPDC048420 TaxID=3155755 RepID=UPI00344935AA